MRVLSSLSYYVNCYFYFVIIVHFSYSAFGSVLKEDEIEGNATIKLSNVLNLTEENSQKQYENATELQQNELLNNNKTQSNDTIADENLSTEKILQAEEAVTVVSTEEKASNDSWPSSIDSNVQDSGGLKKVVKRSIWGSKNDKPKTSTLKLDLPLNTTVNATSVNDTNAAGEQEEGLSEAYEASATEKIDALNLQNTEDEDSEIWMYSTIISVLLVLGLTVLFNYLPIKKQSEASNENLSN